MFLRGGSEHKTRHRYAKINLSAVGPISCNKDLLLQSIPFLMVEELSLTVLIELIKTSVPQRERITTELRIPLARRYLQIILSDPGCDPLDLAVAGEEPPA